MATIEALKRRIDSTRELKSVVSTMKSLAAVNIRQYEGAAASLSDYNRTVETGLQAVLMNRPGARVLVRKAPLERVGAVIFGSDQGMCGPLNEGIVRHARKTLAALDVPADERRLLVVGDRANAMIEPGEYGEKASFSVPGSLSGVGPTVHDLLLRIEGWSEERRGRHVYLFHNEQSGGASYEPRTVHLLPVDADWLERLRQRPWESSSLPIYTMNPDAIFSSLIREYLFVSLFRAMVDSLAAENASRLAAMQGAERNISDQLDALQSQYHQKRQMTITEELLDIVSGFEALSSGGHGSEARAENG